MNGGNASQSLSDLGQDPYSGPHVPHLQNECAYLLLSFHYLSVIGLDRGKVMSGPFTTSFPFRGVIENVFLEVGLDPGRNLL